MDEQTLAPAEGSLEHKARHEAAHAAVAWHLGQTLVAVAIGPDPRDSHVPSQVPAPTDPEACRRGALVCLASEAAGNRDLVKVFRTTDWSRAKGHCEAADPKSDSGDATFRLFWEARALVATLEPTIGRLAAALLERRRLDGAEACAILAEAMASKGGAHAPGSDAR